MCSRCFVFKKSHTIKYYHVVSSILQTASFSAKKNEVIVTVDDEQDEPEIFVDPTLSSSKQKAHVWDLDTKLG